MRTDRDGGEVELHETLAVLDDGEEALAGQALAAGEAQRPQVAARRRQPLDGRPTQRRVPTAW